LHRVDTVILGGGAGGLMVASLLPKGTALIVDKNRRLGAKIAISGGGKCNITNANMGSGYYHGEEYFVQTVLDSFDQEDLLRWLEARGLTPVVRKKSQYFCPHSSSQILEIFEQTVKGQRTALDCEVDRVEKKGEEFFITSGTRCFVSKRVVVASGGLSFPRLGATAIGYEIAKSFGHTITSTAPALVGLTLQREQFFFKELAGASTEVMITVGDHQCGGSLLFAHKGISGPAVLDASLYWNRGSITIDFLPHFTWEEMEGSNKLLSSALPLAKRITKAFLIQLQLEDRPYRTYSAKERECLGVLQCYTFAPAGTFGYSKAEVTKGGVAVSEINPYTMMSLNAEGLYFVGEVIDVTGVLGGYNFQWAFSSAYSCAEDIKRRIDEA
jgi:predicted Rossmann fold flavoprotein